MNDTSPIDYILEQSSNGPRCLQHIHIYDESADNLSDHVPVKATTSLHPYPQMNSNCAISPKVPTKSDLPPKVIWEKSTMISTLTNLNCIYPTL